MVIAVDSAISSKRSAERPVPCRGINRFGIERRNSTLEGWRVVLQLVVEYVQMIQVLIGSQTIISKSDLWSLLVSDLSDFAAVPSTASTILI